MKLVCFLFVIGLMFSLAGSAFAKVELEVTYPETAGETLTATTSLPVLIKYVFNFFIIIALLVVVFSLIYGGISYLSSIGRPEAMAAARKRIFGAGLGLFILLGAYLLLQVLNPQLLILRTKRISIDTGIILLNADAYISSDVRNALMSSDKDVRDAKIQELLDAPATPGTARAQYLTSSIPDTIKEFGEFEKHVITGCTWRDPDPATPVTTKCNFKDFKLEALYFLPGANMKVLTYPSRYFQPMPVHEYVYPDCSVSTGPCKFKSLDEDPGFGAKAAPPMSIQIKGIGKGVYLFSDKLGEELYRQTSVDDLGDFDFNDKAQKIEIRNWTEKEGAGGAPEWEKTANYLAILHDDKYFEGQLRIFFEEFSLPFVPGGMRRYTNNLPEYKPAIGQKTEGVIEDIPTPYGRVNKPSSIQIFQIEDEAKTICEVQICAEPNFVDCYSYLVNETAPSLGVVDFTSHGLANDFLRPVNIPAEIRVDRDKDGEADKDNGDEIKVKLAAADNLGVRSLKIKGSCLTVLFENSILRRDRCLTDPDECWKNKTPGDKSYVFPEGSYPDLEVYPIGQCHCYSFLGKKIRECWPCASAIAIYPVK